MTRTVVAALNGRWHRTALAVFGLVVVVHWLEHLSQAVQIWGLGQPRPEARGLLGEPLPWLVTEEWLHYGFAIVMLVAFALLLPGFRGASRWLWLAALGLQFWHHAEHAMLLVQALTDTPWFGRPVPTSVVQLVVGRVELHLLYNGIVTVPMLAAMWLHRHVPRRERHVRLPCSCRRLDALAAAGLG